MKVVTVSRFDRGMADDPLSPGQGEFRIAKHFDILTNPRRLQPKRGMTTHTASTGIGNLIVVSDGFMYGVGTTNAGADAMLYFLDGYGNGDGFRTFAGYGSSSAQTLSSSVPAYDFLVDWPDAGNVRRILWKAGGSFAASNYAGGGGSLDSYTLSTTVFLSQGLVHPKDKYLYFAYGGSTPYIALIAPNATSFAGINTTAFQLPAGYRVYHLAQYGDFLAIGLTQQGSIASIHSNIVALWNRNTATTLFTETIPWGAGVLKVLNNLNGILIGISEWGSDSIQAGTPQDYNAIQIKAWAGGGEPTVIKEIKAIALSGASGKPSVVLNHRVNFIKNNRLYFSATINPNDGIQPSRTGLWSVGKSKTTGEWTVNLEHMGTNAGSETSVIAAAIVGDYTEIVHTAEGTLTKSTSGNPSSTTYGATSIYESGINPEMSELDRVVEKQLKAVQVNCEKLPTSATVAVKYRVDSNGDDDDWITIATLSTAGEVKIERTNASGETFIDGVNYEFRIESTGGAVITSFSYAYDTKQSNLYAS